MDNIQEYINKELNRNNINDTSNIINNDIDDINNYELAEEENYETKNNLDLMNIFIIYFKKLFERKESDNMFENIDFDNIESTNRCMEMFYEELLKFQSSTYEDKDCLYLPNEININNFNELYGLYIDNKQKFCSRSLIIIIQYLTTLDWKNITWSIVPLK